MTVELLTQVRSYYEQIDKRQTPIRPNEIAQLLENLYDLPAKPLPLRRPRPELWVAAAAAVVLVVALGTWLFSRSEPDDTIVDQPTTTTTAETPEDALSDEGFTIIRASVEGHVDAEMRSVVSGGPGLVAVGTSGDDAAVWTSTDGSTWSQVAGDTFESAAMINDVVVDDAIGLVAVGGLRSRGGPDSGAVVWMSADGRSWDRVFEDLSADGPQMNAVVAAGPGLVAVGGDCGGAPILCEPELTRPAVWTSVDGVSWSEVNGDQFGRGVIYDVVVAPSGTIVAVGSAVWTSPDGSSWTLVYDSVDEVYGPGDASNGIRAVTVGGPGLVGVGWGGAVWTSVDGRDWTWDRIRYVDGEIDYRHLMGVVSDGSGLFAVAERSIAGEAALFTSPDGASWTVVGPRPGTPGRAFSSSGPLNLTVTEPGVVVVVGTSFEDVSGAQAQDEAAVWIVTPGAPPEATQAELDEAFTDGVALVSSMLAAYNEGRYEDWLTFFTVPDGSENAGVGAEDERFLMAANGSWILEGECRQETIDRLSCPTLRRDDFFGAGGFERRINYVFTLYEGQIARYEPTGGNLAESDWFDEYFFFSGEFQEWLTETYPAVALELLDDEQPSMLTNGFGPEDVPTLLPYLDEFVAQSDAYPVPPGG